jgi:hypothetical protein
MLPILDMASELALRAEFIAHSFGHVLAGMINER